jgi:glycosyltransferase involved in cell wall biosynthesis
MEALAAGVPLVVSDLPVLREVFDGAARFAHDVPSLAKQLLLALSDPPSATGRALAARHTWQAAGRAHLDVYRSRLNAPNQAG